MKNIDTVLQWFFIWLLGVFFIFTSYEIRKLKEVVTIQSHTIDVLIDIAKAQTHK